MSRLPEKRHSTQITRLREWLRSGDAVPIERLALALAEDAYPGLDIQRYEEVLDHLARPLIEADVGTSPPEVQALALADAMYDRGGFRGNESDYYDPRNSYLNEVIDRRTGIPITLGVVTLALCRRAGVAAEGILFPGHFLVRLGGAGGRLVDPFQRAKLLDDKSLEALLQRVTGRAQRVKARHVTPATPRAILLRILTNLKGIYSTRRDHARVMLVCDRLIDLGADVTHLRDRGMAALALGATASARADLEAYLDQDPEPADAGDVRAALAGAAPGHLN